MKCPSCAEEIQVEAKKCRFCGQVLTKAVKMGYPEFYKYGARLGYLSFDTLCWDYGDFLYPNDGFLDCCITAGDPVACLFIYQSEEERTKFREKAIRFIQAMAERLDDITAESQEALILEVMMRYIGLLKGYALNRHDNLTYDPKTLQYSITEFTKLRQTLSTIEPKSRKGFESIIDTSIKTCQERLRNLHAS